MGRQLSFFSRSLVLGTLALACQVFAQASPSAFTTAHLYDTLGREVGMISPSANGTAAPFLATRKTYNNDGRLVKVESGSLSSWQSQTVTPSGPVSWTGFTVVKTVVSAYNAAGQKISDEVFGSDSNPYGLTQYSYDAGGQLKCTAVRINPATFSNEPDACTQGTLGSLGPDRISQNIYDVSARTVQVLRAVGTPQQQAYATYAYSSNNKQTDMVDANGNHAQFVYDGFDRQTYWYFPSPTAATAYNPSTQASALSSANAVDAGDYEQYSYDANGNRTTLRKRDGQLINFGYDALNRMIAKNFPATPSANVQYCHDFRGLETCALFGGNGRGITRNYDAFGRLGYTIDSTSGFVRQISYQYDADGNRTRVIHPDGAYFSYLYDGLDRMTNATWWTASTGTVPFVAIIYDSAGRRSLINRASSYTGYSYDPDSRLSGLSQQFAGNVGNTTSGYGYNSASQIVSRSNTNDAFTFTAAINVNRTYTPNGLNQYTTAGPASFTYDMNGNLTSDGSTTYTYDAENKLVSASGVKTATLTYDPLGRLAQTSSAAGTTSFLYDGDQLIAEYDANNNLLRRYMFGSDTDEPILWDEGGALNCSGTRVMHANHQGSIIATADCWGNQKSINTYDEYGIPGASNTGRFQYTGQAWIPELGMNYYKARMYSPTLGRFMQTDPIGYKDQANLYEYVGDDPVDGRDPSGSISVGIVGWRGMVMSWIPQEVPFLENAQNAPGIENKSSAANNTKESKGVIGNSVDWVKNHPGTTAAIVGTVAAVGTVICVIAEPCGIGEGLVVGGAASGEAAVEATATSAAVEYTVTDTVAGHAASRAFQSRLRTH